MNTGMVWNPGARVTDGKRFGVIQQTDPEKGLQIAWEPNESDENPEHTWHQTSEVQHAE